MGCDQCGTTDGELTRCKYCLQTQYCGDACRESHWVKHESECNVIHVERPGMSPAIPSVGEECLPEDIASQLNPYGPAFQQYICYSYGSDGLYQELIGANASKGGSKLGYGAKPGSLAGIVYDLELSIQSSIGVSPQVIVMKDLSIGKTAIYKGASGIPGELARGFARAVNSDPETLVLWPSTEILFAAIAQKFRDFTIPAKGALYKLRMLVEGREVLSMDGPLCPAENAGGSVSFFTRAARKLLPFQKEFAIKLGKNRSINANPSSLEMLRANDDKGNMVQFIFSVIRNKNGAVVQDMTLMDIEFRTSLRKLQYLQYAGEAGGSAPAPPQKDLDDDDGSMMNSGASISRDLDPNNTDHMNGLIAAMEEQMAEGSLQEFKNTFILLKDHRDKLESGPPDYEANQDISAAVHAVTTQMYQDIGLRWKAAYDKNYYKMHKDDPIEFLATEVQTLNVPDRTEGNWKQKLARWGMGKVGKAKGRLRAIQAILRERILQTTNTQERAAIAKLNTIVAQKLNGLEANAAE